MLKRNQKGFTLIELLIVVAIIGIIAAIAIPNLLNAIQRGKQKRTMGDLRTVATAVESYSIDNNMYPVDATLALVATFLEPTYIKKAPQTDGWNTTMAWEVDAPLGTEYTITSYGKDGAPGGPDTDGIGPTTSFLDDIIISVGSFVAYPEGSQDN